MCELQGIFISLSITIIEINLYSPTIVIDIKTQIKILTYYHIWSKEKKSFAVHWKRPPNTIPPNVKVRIPNHLNRWTGDNSRGVDLIGHLVCRGQRTDENV